MFMGFPNRVISVASEKHCEDVMHYIDNEIKCEERRKFEFHLGK